MVYTRYPTERENLAKWYSEELMHKFRCAMMYDVEAKQHDPDAALPVNELAKYVGLVHLLLDDVIQRFQETKLARMKEQKRQRRRSASCKLKLAQVSALSSSDARERAHNIVLLFMKVY
jgi:hypothetical protein